MEGEFLSCCVCISGIENLPCELQRNFQLMRELDQRTEGGCSQGGESSSPRQGPGGGAAGVGSCLRESAGSVQSGGVPGAPTFLRYNPRPLLAVKVCVTFSLRDFLFSRSVCIVYTALLDLLVCNSVFLSSSFLLHFLLYFLLVLDFSCSIITESED